MEQTQVGKADMDKAPRSNRTWMGMLGALGAGALLAYLFWPTPDIPREEPYSSDGFVYEQEAAEPSSALEEKKMRDLLDKAPLPDAVVAPPLSDAPPLSPALASLPEMPSLPLPMSEAPLPAFPTLPPAAALPAFPAAPTAPALPIEPAMPKEASLPLPPAGSLPPVVDEAPLPFPAVPTLPAVPEASPTLPPRPGDFPKTPLHFALPAVPLAPLVGDGPLFPPADPLPPPLEPGPAEEKRLPIDRPLESRPPPGAEGPLSDAILYRTPMDPPIGFAGKSGIVPRDTQTDPRFVPMEDRWRIGFPPYDRYGQGFPPVNDYLYRPGVWYDPYNQNVLKGDYPIIGQHIFLEITGSSRSVVEPRQVPAATTPFESTRRPFQEDFFGNPSQLSYQQFFLLSFDLFHGDASFRPMDWRVKITPVFNFNYLAVEELALVNPDVRAGRFRERTFFSLQEWFVEAKLADLGPNYDFVSARLGSQFFNSDFRGFLFVDTNRAARIFGTRNSNREQFNLAYFSQQEKDTNSELNTMTSRNQGVLIGNYFIQDFIWPGYTAQFSFHYNHDDPSAHFDKNRALVRPDPAGVAKPHGLDIFYLGWTGDGHINRINVNHAIYYAFGKDYLNPIANRGVDVSAGMGALELSYDRDYIRFRSSFFWASGDDDPRNGTACGFDAILDNPNFAGGDFSYWQRQSIRLFGVNLVNRQSLIPNLRSSKLQGQSNFVNPGLFLANAGMDIEITPRFRMINNVNFLWFDHTAVLRQFVYAAKVDQSIGTDLSTGFEWRPRLNNNVIFRFGASALLPSQGFYDLYNNLRDSQDPLVAAFADLVLLF